MDSPTTITFTVADGTDDRGPGAPALNSALIARLRWVFIIVVIAMACVGLSTGNVPVANRDPVSGISPMDLSYVACMDGLDLPVSVDPPSLFDAASSLFGDASIDMHEAQVALWRDPYGKEGIFTGTFNLAYDVGGLEVFGLDSVDDITAFFRIVDLISGPLLIVDGVDYSKQYVGCLDQSGYTDQVVRDRADQISAISVILEQGGTEDDSTVIPDQIRINNQWAACARAHGWFVLDSTVPSMWVNRWPEADLPSTITPEQLRSLLVSCPNFDADKQRSIDQWAQEHNGLLVSYPHPDDVYNPVIGFRLSPLETAYLSVLFTDAGKPLFTRLMSLYSVLDEQRLAYEAAAREQLLQENLQLVQDLADQATQAANSLQ